jgi:hypothetical protein
MERYWSIVDRQRLFLFETRFEDFGDADPIENAIHEKENDTWKKSHP